MMDVLRRSPLAVFIAVAIHVAIILLMVFGLDWIKKPEPIKRAVPMVQARLIDSKKLQTEINKLDKAKKKEIKRQDDLKKKREAEKKKLKQLEQKKLQREKDEKAKKEKQKKEAVAEKKRQADIKLKKEEKAKAEKKRKADADRKKAEAEKKRKADEAKKKADAEKKRKAAEAKKKAEAEKKRKAAAAKKAAERKAREAALAAEVEAEQDASEMIQVISAITRKVEQNWLRPAGTEGLKCTLQVRLGNTGSVLLAKVTRSSGNGGFDRSVEAAVRKADPLPMPKSPRLKSQFRDIEFVFDPNR